MLLRRDMRTIVVAAACAVLPAAAKAGELADLVHQLQEVSSLAFTASVEMPLFRPGEHPELVIDQTVRGEVRYYAAGDKWLVDSYLDSPKFDYLNTVVAYNGAAFYYYLRDRGILSIMNGPDRDNTGVMLAIPALAPFQFLIPQSGENAARTMQLKDFQAAAAAAELDELVWQEVEADGRTYERTELPGAAYQGKDYSFFIYARNGERGRPVMIERVSANGELLARTIMTHWRTFIDPEGVMTVWPMHVAWQGFEPATGKLGMEMSMIIDWMAVNDPAAVPQEVFTLQAAPDDKTIIDGQWQVDERKPPQRGEGL